MDDDIRFRRLRTLRAILPVLYGVAGSLLIVALAGDLEYFYAKAPRGWFLLWIPTTLASLAVGLFLLSARLWRPISLAERRGTATAYLVIGLISFFSLAVAVQAAVHGPEYFALPAAYAIALLGVYARVYVIEDRNKADTFP